MPMNHKDVLNSAIATLKDRGVQYGQEDLLFDKASRIASTMLDRVVTPYEIAIVHIATKLARMAANPDHMDSYIDSVNYIAFAAQFVTKEMTQADKDEIVSLARKFAPINRPKTQDEKTQDAIEKAIMPTSP